MKPRLRKNNKCINWIKMPNKGHIKHIYKEKCAYPSIDL